MERSEMADLELLQRIEALRSDFARQRGESFEHFYCPILLRDEKTELCRGHIVNEAFETSNVWLPQRKDVDNFFGSAVEADLITIVCDRGKSPYEILRDARKGDKLRPRLLICDKEIEHYFPRPNSPPVAGHTRIQLVVGNAPICNLAVKSPKEELEDAEFTILIDAEFRHAAIASMIKTAHLTLFKMFGYSHVLSYAGKHLADILGKFYEKHKPPAKCSGTDVERHFHDFEKMVVPLGPLGDDLKGTLTDNRALALFGQSGKMFALGVIVKAGPAAFCVFVPGEDSAIDTYFSFVGEPPPSVAVRIAQYRPGSGREKGCWETPEGEPRRVVLHSVGSESSWVERQD